MYIIVIVVSLGLAYLAVSLVLGLAIGRFIQAGKGE